MGCTCDAGKGVIKTYREYLGEHFFSSLQEVQEAGGERIIVWFEG